MKTKIILFALLNLFFFSSIGFSQSIQKNSDWELSIEKNGVQFYTKTVDCHDETNGIHKEVVLIKITNTTTYKFEIKWKNEIWYDNNCFNCNSKNKEYQFTNKLEGGQSKEGDCINKEQGLIIFSKFLNYNDKSKLTKFNLVDVEVNPL